MTLRSHLALPVALALCLGCASKETLKMKGDGATVRVERTYDGEGRITGETIKAEGRSKGAETSETTTPPALSVWGLAMGIGVGGAAVLGLALLARRVLG